MSSGIPIRHDEQMTEPQQVLARLSAEFVTLSQTLARASAELTQLADSLQATPPVPGPAATQPPAQPAWTAAQYQQYYSQYPQAQYPYAGYPAPTPQQPPPLVSTPQPPAAAAQHPHSPHRTGSARRWPRRVSR